jgi:hypothetical protein
MGCLKRMYLPSWKHMYPNSYSLGAIVDYDVGLSYRPASLWFLVASGGQGHQPYAIADYILQPGTKNLASEEGVHSYRLDSLSVLIFQENVPALLEAPGEGVHSYRLDSLSMLMF